MWISVGKLRRLSPLVLLSGLALAETQGQETPPPPRPPQTETPGSAEVGEPPAPPPGAPSGVLPVAEIARIERGARERPRVLLQGGALLLVTESGSVELYQAANGEFTWKLGLPGEALETPVVLGADPLELLLATKSGKLLFVDGATGRITREIALGFDIALAPFVADRGAPGSVEGRTLYLGTPSGVVVAYDPESESERFRTETAEKPNAFALAGATLVVSGASRTLTAIDAERGTIRWNLRARAGFSAPAAFSGRDRLYVGDDAGEFYCLDAMTGETRFRWSTGAAVRASPLIYGNRVYVASYGNTLYAYDAGGGSEQWRANLPGRPASGPILVHQRLLVATFDGVLVEVSLDAGAISERYVAPEELGSAPSFAVAVPDAPGGEGPDISDTSTTAPEELVPPAPRWYEKHRVALPLRSGAVLLLGHKPPDPVEPEATETPKEPMEKEPKQKPPGGASSGHLSWKEDAVGPPISLWCRDLELEWILHSVL